MALTKLSDYNKNNIIYDKAINTEGGYVDNKNDAGGITAWGITQRLALQYKTTLTKMFKWDGDMHHLSQPMAFYVYDQEFWAKMNLDDVFNNSPLLADLLFEAGINFGADVVVRWFQIDLNVLNKMQTYAADLLVDGDLGSKTISALQAILDARPSDALKNIIFMISAQASTHYIDLAMHYTKDEVFESGWQNRARLQYNVYLNILGLN